MNAVLADIIERFRAAQDRAVAALAELLGGTLGVPLPTSNREWVAICAEHGLYNVHHVNGVEIHAHGYGIELIFPDLTIDFDWGDAGEPDGFDAWRLWNFVRVNRLDLPCESYAQLQSWLEDASHAGELAQNRLYGLYYSPAHRARGRRVENGHDLPAPPTS